MSAPILTGPSQMLREIEEIPQAAARLSGTAQRAAAQAMAAVLRDHDPAAMVTIARGSSDHAALVLKYAIETRLGLPVASVGPSVVTVWDAPLSARGLAVLAISQSGQSPDLVALATRYAQAGAPTCVLTNAPASPLARAGTQTFDISAGPEQAVAATKTYVNSVLAGMWVLADWADDAVLAAALGDLPDRLAKALAGGPDGGLTDILGTADKLLVVGRGPGLGIAAEVALKCAETCGIHASAYSAAEVLHGPSALIGPGTRVLMLDSDQAVATQAAAEQIAAQGGALWPVAVPLGAHPFLAGLEQLVAIYLALEAASRARGRNPDAPPHLRKETSTL